MTIARIEKIVDESFSAKEISQSADKGFVTALVVTATAGVITAIGLLLMMVL